MGNHLRSVLNGAAAWSVTTPQQHRVLALVSAGAGPLVIFLNAAVIYVKSTRRSSRCVRAPVIACSSIDLLIGGYQEFGESAVARVRSIKSLVHRDLLALGDIWPMAKCLDTLASEEEVRDQLVELYEDKLPKAPTESPHDDFGVVFQDPVLFPWRTVRANVESARPIANLNWSTRHSGFPFA